MRSTTRPKANRLRTTHPDEDVTDVVATTLGRIRAHGGPGQRSPGPPHPPPGWNAEDVELRGTQTTDESAACWGQSHFERGIPTAVPGGTDTGHHPPLHYTLHRTAACAAATGLELPCLYAFWLPAAAAAAALASAPSATASSEPTKGPAAGYFHYRHRLLLRRHCHHDWPAPGQLRRSLVPSFYRHLVFLMERRPDQTAAAPLLHCTCTVFLGHTQTRVDSDLRVAPLLL